MKERIFDLTKRPEDKETEYALVNAWGVMTDMLSEEDENKVRAEFKEYMETCKKEGKDYTPAYLWFLQRIKISL